MDVAIVAPCPVPYMVGGAENLWRGLQDYLNDHTIHQAEIIKLPSREFTFWELVDSYRRFAELDLSGFDLVVSSKYPAWMVAHENHVVYMVHRLRGLYDTYHFLGMPERHPTQHPAVEDLRAFMAAHVGERAALPELFSRIDGLRDAADLPGDLFAFPGPFVREVVHALDGIGLAPAAIRKYGAISQTVAQRPAYFPDGARVFVVHPPTSLAGLRTRRGSHRRGSYLFTASRLDGPKRVELLIRAVQHTRRDIELRVAGTGPEEERLRELAGNGARIHFCGRVSAAELAALYRGAQAVAFVPYDEDYGFITLEAMLCGKPVVTCTDSGGTRELVDDGQTGLVVEPQPEALAAAIDRLWTAGRLRRQMGAAALTRAQRVTWDGVVRELVA